MNRIVWFFVFYVSFGYSQTLQVKYNMLIDMGGVMPSPFNHEYQMINSDGKSLQKKFLAQNLPSKGVDKNNQASTFVKIGNDTTYIYKDFENNRLLSEENIFTKAFNVADELKIFSWQMEEDTLTILNYKCRKASTRFRGREFVAYFTEDIPISDGPAKFNGLPGLILKVLIIDPISVFSIEATEIRFEKSTKDILNPFVSRKIMAFSDFKKEYNRKYSEMQSFAREQSGNVTIPKGGVELLSDE